MTKYWKISLLTLLIIIFLGRGGIFEKYNTSSFFQSDRVLAQATTERKMEADQLLQQGIEQLASKDTNQANSSLTLFENALAIYQQIQDRGGEGQALKNISNFYYQQQNYSQALDYAQQTLTIAQEIQDADLEARAFNNQGLIYYTQNNYPLAIESYQNGLSIMQQVSSQELELKLNLNIANAYKDSINYEDAVTHYENALAIAKKTNELYPQYIILNNLAEIYAEAGNREQANFYQQQALEVAKQIDVNEMNSSPKETIKGITVPSIFDISLKGDIDGRSFENLSGILEIQSASEQDPNPFMVSLVTLDPNQTSPENAKLGNLIWQSYTPGHPQEQEHYSRISVDNNIVRMEINPVNGYRSDIGWSTDGSLFDELRNLNEELERTEEEFNLPKQEEDIFDEDLIPIPNQPNSLQVVPRSGVLTFSVQGDRIVGTINASGITSSEINHKAKVSRYQAEFVGEPIQAQSNNKRVKDFDLLERNNFNVNQTKATRKNSSIDKFFINKEFKKKLNYFNISDNFFNEKSTPIFSLQGSSKALVTNIKSSNYNQKELEKIFVDGSWVFFNDGTFLFSPPKSANVRDDLYPISGNYTQDNNTLIISGERESSSALASVDGIISLENKEPHLDIIYNISSHSYNIVEISQVLSPENIKLPNKIPSTEIKGIQVPSTYKIALQGEIDDKPSDKLYGFLKIKPNNSLKKSHHPFVINLQIYAPDKNGSLGWIPEELFPFNGSEITINNNQISLKLKPNADSFDGLNWWTFPTGYAKDTLGNVPVNVTATEGSLTFTLDGDQVSGTITATGEGAAWQTSTYQANFEGEREVKPPSFQGIWQEKKFRQQFGEINLEQSGQKVTGTYSANSGGVIEGIARGNRLDFTWKDAENEGKGFFRLASHGKFLTGTLTDKTQANKGQSFVAERTKESYPNPIAPELANDRWYLNDLGQNLMLQGRYEEALILLEAAHKLHNDERKLAIISTSKNYNYLSDQAGVIRNLTRCYFQTKNYDNLLKSLDNAIEVQQIINQDRSYDHTSYEVNSTRSQLNRYIESWRISLTQDQDKITALDQAQPFFNNLITYLVELDFPNNNNLLAPENTKSRNFEVALLASENARARAFADLLEKKVSKDPISAVTAKPPTIKQTQKIAKEQNATLVEYWIDDNDIKASDEQQTQKSNIYIWVVQPDGKIDFRQVPLNSSTSAQKIKQNINNSIFVTRTDDKNRESSLVTETVSQIRSAFGLGKERAKIEVVGSRRIDSQENLRELHQLLIEPITDLLPANSEERVVFIPQGGLFLVPFPALQEESGKYLIEKHTILTAPSIQVLDLTRKQKDKLASSRDFNPDASERLIVGNPTMPTLSFLPDQPSQQLSPLKGAEEEAIEIAKFFDTEALTGDKATKTTILQKMSNARLIHFATHGLLEYGIPEDSLVRDVPGALAFAPSNEDNGLLTSSEILDLSLNARLAVLSACDTGRGKITGDGVIGLSRSLIAAGVPSVIVSLWSVPDAPTADLMTEFYKQLKANPDKAQALRQAMLTTMKTHPHPVDWAAFTLIGEAE